MKRQILLCTLVAVGLSLFSCSESNSPTSPLNAILSVRVLRSGDNAALPGAAVEVRRTMEGPVVLKTKTGNDGESRITTLADGEYWVRVTPPAGYTFPEGLTGYPNSRIVLSSPGIVALTAYFRPAQP